MRTERLGRAVGLARIILSDPGQVRFVPTWARVLRRSTLDSRMPWLPFRIIDLLDEHLETDSRVFEYGGGGSTVWFAERAGTVVTVEHDDDWFPMLQDAVDGVPGCTVMHRGSSDAYRDYVDAISTFPDEYFDVVVVDGRERVRCLEAAMPKVRPGGLLLLDDSDRPRYATAHDLASSWPHRTLGGLTPAKAVAGVTTVWRRP